MHFKGLSCLLLALIASVATADARSLLHKHHKHHGWHHGHCKTIAQVLHETPSLSRFAKAFDDAKVPFITGLVNDPHARATFLAVQDDNLGTGDMVFDEAAIRFQQHTTMDHVKTCKAKDGDIYSTLAGTKLTAVKDSAARKGRKLQQLSTAWTSLLDVLPGDAETVPDSSRPVSNVAFALPQGQPVGRPMQRPGQPKEHEKVHDGKGHKKWHHEGNDDDDHYGHGHGKHGKHGKHGWHDKHHEWSAKDMVAHALSKAEQKAAKHGTLYLQSNVTSQRVKVLASVHACEGIVLIVSAFLNAPPTPDPAAVLAGQQSYFAHKIKHADHHGPHHHHHAHHRHSWLGCVKHAFEVWEHRLEHMFSSAKPHGKRCHGKRHGKHAKIQKHDPPNDPELLAYYAAHDRHGQSKAIEVEAEAEAMHATQAAVASILNGDGSLRSGKKEGHVTVYKLPATEAAQVQRLADPRAVTFQEVNHTPLVLPSAAAEAWREVRSWLSGVFW